MTEYDAVLDETSESARHFDSRHVDPPTQQVTQFLLAQRSSCRQIVQTTSARKRLKHAASLLRQLEDFLFAHGRRFGYLPNSTANASEMWRLPEDEINFDAIHSLPPPDVGSLSQPWFEQLLDESLLELDSRTRTHEKEWHIQRTARWELPLGEGILKWHFSEGHSVHAPAQIVGTYDTKDNSWLWAWANPSIPFELQQAASRVRAFGEDKHICVLTEPRWLATELQGWRMTALAARLCGASGAYRGAAGDALVFLTFGAVSFTPSA